jgi:hypothetical protein
MSIRSGAWMQEQQQQQTTQHVSGMVLYVPEIKNENFSHGLIFLVHFSRLYT